MVLDFLATLGLFALKYIACLQHTEVADQIDRDLQRTHPDMKFFSGESSYSKKNRVYLLYIIIVNGLCLFDRVH